MKLGETNSARIISCLVGFITVAAALGIPLGYYVVSYRYVVGSLESEAEINADIVSQIISTNPGFWEFVQVRLVEVLSRRPRVGYPEARRIINSKNTVVAESSDKLSPPVVTRSRPVMDAGYVVGKIEISRSLTPLLERTGLMALLMLPLGLGVFAIIYLLPIRVIHKTEEALKKTNEELMLEISVRKSFAEEVRKLNEGLEVKVEERTKQLLDAQEELVRQEKLATLGQLSGSVAHELRNPMGVISNAVYFLQTVMPDADETVREYLAIIKSEVSNSQRIISDLLDFSRAKTPQSELSPVNTLISRSLARCVIPDNVDLRLDIPDTLPAVNADPLHMEQVFKNLVTNAAQAMPEGGELIIGARRNENDFVEITISDTGEGISPDNIKKLFQPLFTTKARGIGLGLAVVKNLIDANGGRIEVNSQVGKGATITVILPAADKGDRNKDKEKG